MLKRLYPWLKAHLAQLKKPLRIVLSIGLLVALIRHIPTDDLKTRLSTLDPWLGLWALLLLVLSNVISALRWRVISNAWSPVLTPLNACRHYFIGQTLNQVLPGATVSGDAYRASAVQGLGLRWRDALTSVLLDRISGLLILLLMAGIGLSLNGTGANGPGWVPTGTLAGVLTVLGFSAGLIYLRLSKRSGRLPEDLNSTLLILTSILVQVAAIASFLVALIATGVAPTWQISLLIPLVFIAAAIPLGMAGWGTREMATVFCLAWAGVDPASALAASLLSGVCNLLQGLGALPLLLHSAFLSKPPTKDAHS